MIWDKRTILAGAFFFTTFLFYGQKVQINGLFPQKVSSGSEMIVSFTIQKGNLNDFARFQLEVPDGVSVSPRILKNGEFSFDNNIVKIVWMKIPPDDIVEISLFFKIPVEMEGYKVFKGVFSYADGTGKRTSIEMLPQIVIIEKDEFRANLSQEIEFNYSYFSQKGVTCVRQKPYLDDSGHVVVKLLITKGELNEFGRIEETVPYGFKAVNLKSSGAIFAFNPTRRKVKFIWMNMPNSSQFIVAYKLIPETPIDKIPFILNGTFTFAENRNSRTVIITELSLDVDKAKSQ
ncbi:MAG TPA: hypothetical protein PK990_10230 [Salinivirgaceae bacterium]|nr:hypothetical protein [Salinivirgaceae bacterium]